MLIWYNSKIVQTASQGTIYWYPVKPNAYLLTPYEHELTFEDIQPISITLLSLSPF